ncbi:MAG: hypothetical protein K8H88_04360 [Sandaracinaceae bacterium]|nr:hypothetical protein [Sandaracinaceae bacterium]
MRKRILQVLSRFVRLPSLALVVVTVGCGAAAIHSVPVGVLHPPPTTPERVWLLLSTPRCPFQDVAFVEGESRGDSVDVTLELMRARAARYGADALVLVQHQDGAHGNNHAYNASAVVFTDPSCRG